MYTIIYTTPYTHGKNAKNVFTELPLSWRQCDICLPLARPINGTAVYTKSAVRFLVDSAVGPIRIRLADTRRNYRQVITLFFIRVY